MKDRNSKKDHSKKDVPTRKDPENTENKPPVREPGHDDYGNKGSDHHKKYTQGR